MKAELESLWDQLRDCRMTLREKRARLRHGPYDYEKHSGICREIQTLNTRISHLEYILPILHYISGLRVGLSVSDFMKYVQEGLEDHEVLFLSTRDSGNTLDYLDDYGYLVGIVDTMAAHVHPAPLCEPLMNLVDPEFSDALR